MKITHIIKEAGNSFKSILKNKSSLAYSVIADLLFVFLYGVLTSSFYQEILFNIIKISEEAGKYSIIKGSSAANLISSLKNQPEINLYIKKILFNILVIMLIVYFLYCILQGFSWFIANRIANKKVNFLDYIKKFFLINILWFLLYNIYNFFNIVLGFRQGYSQKYNLMVADYSKIYLMVLLIIILYFAFISYSLISRYKLSQALKKTFVIGVKKIKYILPVYFIIFIVLFVINYVLNLSFGINPLIMFILGIILALPAVVWARVYMVSTVNRV